VIKFTKNGCHDIAEILLRVALKQKKKIKSNPSLYGACSVTCVSVELLDDAHLQLQPNI
jgi:hypothetical protein